MINFVISPNLKNKKSLVYTIYYLTKNLNCEIKISYVKREEALNIYYGIDCNEGIHIPCDFSTEKIMFSKYKDKLIMSNRVIKEPFIINKNKIEFNYDILFISKYLLTCQEEYEIKNRDDKERFIAELSLRKEKVKIPFFNINSDILLEAINVMNKSIGINKDNFEIFLTHDVDSINSRDKYVFLHNAKVLLTNKNVPLKERVSDLFLDIIYNRHLQIENYIDIESRRKAKSEFYFIEGEKHRLGKRYDLMSIKKQIDKIKNSPNHVIGIHTNYFSYKDKGRIQNEINQIEKRTGTKVKSCRNHYLRFEMPTTLNILSECGIISDSTMGYPDINGFRAGICESYVPYDLNENKLIDIYETPLVVMDGVVMEKSISFQEKWHEIKYNLDSVIKYNGTASVLFHHRVIVSDEYKCMYEKILDYVVDKGGKFVLSKEFENRKKNDIIAIEKLFSYIND
ncbi:DUF7033 domain-containing protein [Haloimpatiens massiliensis]|uniref:DUF7033 domain-containing protein n=1 Tax=Haloimpatiens massiliensis TaxID=1658110 RepID=UPI000C830970|nr:hypothetical protein [Haloimpatiens massiliensis]